MIEIQLTKGQVAIIDDEDFPTVSQDMWQATARRDGKGWYAMRAGGIRMHRQLMDVWDTRIVDHVNGNGLDNRRENLRIGSQAQNCVNRKQTPGKYLRGTKPSKHGRWIAAIRDSGKFKHIGCFDTELEAHEAYLKRATELHGDWMP